MYQIGFTTAAKLGVSILGSDPILRTNAIANAVGYAEHYSRSHDAVIRVYDESGRDPHARTQRRFQRVVSVNAPETKSRHALKRDG